ncbi:MAG: dockerin type I domain-containing protein [Deltaproteobacteria bacterium]|nr:dockerin type I domain-containing protein [Deltaproteobacteria bacterium]
MPHLRVLIAALALLAIASAVSAQPHTLYLANDDHTDYGWNASTATYDQAMLGEIDLALARLAASRDPSAERPRFNADCWYYVWLYERERSPQQFAALIDAIAAGDVTVPLNPFVTLYGALPTEAAIRAGSYPGQLERRYGIGFPLAQDIEDQTSPWGIASLWAGSGVRYTWKGICACATQAPFADRRSELFHWQGPDGEALLTKWYEFELGSTSWGGYAEARDNLSLSAMQKAIDRFSQRGHPVTGLFGYGWDDVSVGDDAVHGAVRQWNDAHPDGPPAVVSNIVDYFADLEGRAPALPTERGGWGNDWDLWPATLAAPSADLRRAVEDLRAGEALAAVLRAGGDDGAWTAHQAALADAWIGYWKYFEHTWSDGGAGLDTIVAHKLEWAAQFRAAVDGLTASASARFAAGFATPAGEDRLVVFNPLAAPRTDVVDLTVDGPGPFVVHDVASGAELRAQVLTVDGAHRLRVLVPDVPSLGYRVLRYAAGTPSASPCCSASAATRRIDSTRYAIEVASDGRLVSLIDHAAGDQELAGSGGLNALVGATPGSGTVTVESLGPVSATLRLDIGGALPRRVRVTVFAAPLDRVEVEDELLARPADAVHYRFGVNLREPQIRFEEVGAVARPGLAEQGGDFLPGTRADYMTLNHFLDFDDALGGYHVTLSSRDAFAVRVGDSSATHFDLPATAVSVLALGNVAFGGIEDQGGATSFRHAFAVIGRSGAFSAAAAMRDGLAFQNPLRGIGLARNQNGPRLAPVASYLSLDSSRAVVTAVKPAEEGERGVLVRLWELAGESGPIGVRAAALAPGAAWRTSLIETDRAALDVGNGVVSVPLAANQLAALRLAVGVPTPTASETPSATRTATPARTATATRSATPTARLGSPTASASPTPTCPSPPRGDVNGDCAVTATDLDELIAALFAPSPGSAADVNLDGAASAADLPALVALLRNR